MWQETITYTFGTRCTLLHVGCGGSRDSHIKERTAGRPDLQLTQPLYSSSQYITHFDMESSESTQGSYVLTLLALIKSEPDAEENPLFGVAMRLDTGSSIYRQTSHRFLQSLIEYSPSPETVAAHFLKELAKCKISAVETLGDAFPTLCDTVYVEYYVQVGSLQNGDRSISPANWAAGVYQGLKENLTDANILPITDLANYYLTNLVIACRVQ